jgi:hypothetical protein
MKDLVRIKLLKTCMHDGTEHPPGAVIQVPPSTADYFCDPAHKIAERVTEKNASIAAPN